MLTDILTLRVWMLCRHIYNVNNGIHRCKRNEKRYIKHMVDTYFQMFNQCSRVLHQISLKVRNCGLL